ncbi:MAG: GNAT family N-acetyltransferase [Anaerolineae bacterium]|nr:GNAT family N-acetyltransferase [Anaerolineae bacterium]
MNRQNHVTHTTIRDLGDGLILRRATPEDTEALVTFHGRVHTENDESDAENVLIGAWVRDLMTRPHPTFGPGDFTIVEDTKTGEIASSLCLISQTWSYDGIEFGVGRPELVGTAPAYRRRGLIRAQMEVVHQWSAERGERVQGITGIPWYYRQFGYEMAMTLGGGRGGYKPNVPKLKEGEVEPYRIRAATESDLPFIAEVYAQGVRRWPVACVRDQALWRDELLGKSEENVNRRDLAVIEVAAGDAAGERVGFITLHPRVWHNRISIGVYELKPGVSWLAVTPSAVRHVWSLGEAYVAGKPDQELEMFGLWLGVEHPAYEVFRERLARFFQPYAWYLRVPDVPGFLLHVAPALNARLAGSPLAGHSGELKLNFYQAGMRLVFEGGRLTVAEPWESKNTEEGDAGFPELTFLQLLFQRRSIAELDEAFADCWVSGDGPRVLLDALFPKNPSDVWPVS